MTGGGTIGQFVALVARALGAGMPAVSDPQPFRRDFTVELGADLGVHPGDAGAMERARNEAGGFDVVFEASGAPPAVRANPELVNRGGTIVQIGSIAAPVELPANLIMAKKLRVMGSFRYGEIYCTAMNLPANRRTDVRQLISATYPFAKTAKAFKLAAERGETVKVQVSVGER